MAAARRRCLGAAVVAGGGLRGGVAGQLLGGGEVGDLSSSPIQVRRHVVGWIMPEPGKLSADEQSGLQTLLDRCPELDALVGHVRAFATMISELRGDRLQEWMEAAQADDLRALHSLWWASAAIKSP